MLGTIHKVGFWSGVIAFASTVAFVIVQSLQLFSVIKFPLDEILIYGFSLCITLPFLFEILALHYLTPVNSRFWSHAALIFTMMYVIFVTSNYVVQLATVIPMKLRGMTQEISILDQTPHSLFWNFDAIGYIFMGFATLFAAPLFSNHGLEGWVKISFLAHGFITPIIAFVYFYPGFSNMLLLIGIPWAITAPVSMLLLAMSFRKDLQGKNKS